MAMVINPEKCNGCGVCVDDCPMEAIELINGIAQIDQKRCRECEACLSACPMGAITTTAFCQPISKPERGEIVKVNPSQAISTSSNTKTKTNNWASVFLALLSSDLIPRMTDLINTVFEQKSQTSQIAIKSTPTKESIWLDYGRQRRKRYRAQYRNHRFSNIKP